MSAVLSSSSHNSEDPKKTEGILVGWPYVRVYNNMRSTGSTSDCLFNVPLIVLTNLYKQ
jgi:hypothetical protein